MHLTSRRPVIRALNRQPLIFGIDWMLYVTILLFCVLVAVLISKIIGGLLLLVLSLAGQHISRKDIQLPKLWALSLLEGGSYDPAKYQDRRI